MDISLPAWLQERTRWEKAPTADTPEGDFVLYWMHNAVRGHENPALDVAMLVANRLDLPLLVYQGLCESYPYASDRHHAFILQGARDVQRELESRGIRYVFHLQRRGDRGPFLKTLTEQSAVMVTEMVPVAPLHGWVERLTDTTSTPIATVDTSCLVPMTVFPNAETRAFQFRKRTEALFRDRVDQPYPEQTVTCGRYEGPLPMQPLDLQDVDLATLIGQCEIDHTVAPVADTPGGSRAGYRRWDDFRDQGLRQYAKRRNDASKHTTSRLSAYLHYGMVSPFRIAREAHEAKAEKFLDELLIWRELAYHFCFHHAGDLDSFAALPVWAQETLETSQADSRDAHLTWEQLARAQSGNALWDTCQRSLLKHGELHNNVRMTWGKAVLPWVRTPREALHAIIDLNHRYALDGRGPCSYGGLLWCLGQFDRPFKPPQPVFGTVRTRPLETHASRIDLAQYARLVDRPITGFPARVAVVGAGLAGLTAARALADHGLQVQLFDKSRGVGGRLATRRAPSGVFFDHGAQYFTVRDLRFARYVCAWMDEGLVAPWEGRIVEIREGQIGEEKTGVERYVGVPAMNSIARHLAQDLPITHETRVSRLHGSPGQWRLESEDGRDLGTFDYVLLNCPPRQAVDLLPPGEPITEQIAAVQMDPCWSVLIELEQPLQLDFDAAFVHDNPLSWIARDSSKPGRPAGVTWILHASGDWSIRHLEDDPDDVLAELLSAFSDATGEMISDAITLAAHRWRYAKPSTPLAQPCVWDPTLQLGACGDWCDGPRVEGAFLSGQAMAGALLRHLTIDRKSPSAQATLFDTSPQDISRSSTAP